VHWQLVFSPIKRERKNSTLALADEVVVKRAALEILGLFEEEIS
jgi:hypothetical protein